MGRGYVGGEGAVLVVHAKGCEGGLRIEPGMNVPSGRYFIETDKILTSAIQSGPAPLSGVRSDGERVHAAGRRRGGIPRARWRHLRRGRQGIRGAQGGPQG